jgi:hypothetical protein
MILFLGRSKVKIKTLNKSWSERRFIGGESRLRFNSSSLEKEILGLPPRFFHPSSLPLPIMYLEDCFFGKCV